MIGSYTTHKASDTEGLGEKFSNAVNPGDAVFLRGELGSGKTTFVKGVARGLGIESRIMSPTFVVVREHIVMNKEARIKNNGIGRMYHLDLYRLKDEGEAKAVDLKDFLDDKNGVTFIEWPDISQNIVEKPVWNIIFRHAEDESRIIEITYG